MKTWTLMLVSLALSGCQACGNIAVGNTAVGQVKKVGHGTPLWCPEYDYADVSLGVLRSNGVGSFSKEDNEFVVRDPAHRELLQRAADSGALVKITYDQRRFMFCDGGINRHIRSIEFEK